MKGMELTITTIVLIILGVIILLIWGIFIGYGRGSVNIILVQNDLRQCCSDRSIWDCDDSTKGTVYCKISWGEGSETLEALASEAGVNDLQKFCNCQ